MAILLAREHGANLLAVARRGDRLQSLKRELEGTKTEFEPLVADLSRLEEVDRVIERATKGRRLYGAILNAGFTHFGNYNEVSWERFREMLDVNVTSAVRMTSALLPELEKNQDGGGLMLVSSLSGIIPTPYQAAYSGTKAFLANYGCCLWYEARKRSVSVTTFAPGGIVTEMTGTKQFRPLRRWLAPVDPLARAAIDAFRSRQQLVVPGLTNKLAVALTGLLPRRLITSLIGDQYGAALERTREG